MKKEIIVYSVSDSLGGTSQRLLSAVTAQYPDLIFNKMDPPGTAGPANLVGRTDLVAMTGMTDRRSCPHGMGNAYVSSGWPAIVVPCSGSPRWSAGKIVLRSVLNT